MVLHLEPHVLLYGLCVGNCSIYFPAVDARPAISSAYRHLAPSLPRDFPVMLAQALNNSPAVDLCDGPENTDAAVGRTAGCAGNAANGPAACTRPGSAGGAESRTVCGAGR